MGRRSTPCTQADLTRLIKAALAAGVDLDRISGVELTREGAKILFGNQKPIQNDGTNPWDEVLDR